MLRVSVSSALDSVWFQTIRLLTQSNSNVAALELSRLLGGCYASVWRLKPKLLETMQAKHWTERRSAPFLLV